MDAIQRLLRRKARREMRRVVMQVDPEVYSEAKERLAADGLSASILFEVFLRGYARRHPSILAVIDEVRRELGRTERVQIRDSLFNRRETEDIYAAIEGDDRDDFQQEAEPDDG